MTKAYRMVGSEAKGVSLAYKKYLRGLLSYSQETQLVLKEMVFVLRSGVVWTPEDGGQ